MITYEDFQKIELRVARILKAEEIEGSRKLVRLQISLGSKEDQSEDEQAEHRQLVAGVGTSYTPEELVGKEIIVLANLEPRQLMGYESQGMLLAADGEDGPVLLQPEREVPEGVSIK